MTLNEIHISLQDLVGPIGTLALIFFSYQLRAINNRFEELEGRFTEILEKIDSKLETLVREDICSERRNSIVNEIRYDMVKSEQPKNIVNGH